MDVSECILPQPVSDDPAQEMENAVAEMKNAWRSFRDINCTGPAAVHGYDWWRELMWLSCAENRLKEAFCSRDRSPRSIAAYQKFRMKVLVGKGYKADA